MNMQELVTQLEPFSRMAEKQRTSLQEKTETNDKVLTLIKQLKYWTDWRDASPSDVGLEGIQWRCSNNKTNWSDECIPNFYIPFAEHPWLIRLEGRNDRAYINAQVRNVQINPSMQLLIDELVPLTKAIPNLCQECKQLWID